MPQQTLPVGQVPAELVEHARQVVDVAHGGTSQRRQFSSQMGSTALALLQRCDKRRHLPARRDRARQPADLSVKASELFAQHTLPPIEELSTWPERVQCLSE
ncbi:MAG: hypothetical protein ACREKJ_03175 [Candidatus Rokuibacteriota bacterium]